MPTISSIENNDNLGPSTPLNPFQQWRQQLQWQQYLAWLLSVAQANAAQQGSGQPVQPESQAPIPQPAPPIAPETQPVVTTNDPVPAGITPEPMIDELSTLQQWREMGLPYSFYMMLVNEPKLLMGVLAGSMSASDAYNLLFADNIEYASEESVQNSRGPFFSAEMVTDAIPGQEGYSNAVPLAENQTLQQGGDGKPHPKGGPQPFPEDDSSSGGGDKKQEAITLLRIINGSYKLEWFWMSTEELFQLIAQQGPLAISEGEMQQNLGIEGPANLGISEQGLFFTYVDGRLSLAPVLPASPVEFSQADVAGNQLERIIGELAGTDLFEFDWVPFFASDEGTTPLTDATINARLQTMKADAGRAYVTITLLTERLGYVPSYQQLVGVLWASEASEEYQRPEPSGITWGGDVETAVANHLSQYCEAVPISQCGLSESLLMFGDYFQAFYNAQVSDTLMPLIDPSHPSFNQDFYDEAMRVGASIIERSSTETFSNEAPYFVGPTDDSRYNKSWDPLRTYEGFTPGEFGTRNSVWTYAGLKKYHWGTGIITQMTQGE